jgi:signal transduction histidine kinase
MDVLRRARTDVALALFLFALMVAELAMKSPAGGEAPPTVAAYLWAGLVTLPVALHRRYPVAVITAVVVGIVGYSLGHFTAFPGYTAFALVFVVSLHSDRGRGAIAFTAMAASIGVALGAQSGTTVTPSTWVSTLLALAVAWLAGENLRSRQQRWLALQERAARLETEREERARQAVTAERLRIARELHDVVAHSMSVIAVQAGVANHVIDSRPELARQALATVETNTRAALVEMRRLLGVLRQGDEPSASLAPAPGLDDVPELVRQLAEAGLRVRLRREGEPAGLPDVADLSAYRIVQEGLTNVLRHGGPEAEVVIGYAPGGLTIRIGDGGRPAGAPTTGSGHGIIGMRERVALFGGDLSAGPRAGGGFDLVATLPYAKVGVAA